MSTSTTHTENLRASLLYLMAIAFIEIRASDSLNAVKKFADTFHNLPMALSKCSEPEDFERAYESVLARAKRNGFEDYLVSLKGIADKKTGNEVT